MKKRIERATRKDNSSRAYFLEKVAKVTCVTSDSKYLIVRNEDFKGIKFIYLEDGSITNEYKAIHYSTIVQILVSKNN